MPGFDGTGPPRGGQGIGGKFVYCGPIQPHIGPYRGGGYGRGPGRGPCARWYGRPASYYEPAQYNPEDEKAFLQEQAEHLKVELDQLQKRMSELEQH